MSQILINLITYPLTFLIGILLNRFFESRPRLITYYGHIAAGKVRINSDSPQIDIFTHSIMIRNIGRKPALNLKVGHRIQSIGNMVAVHPPIEYSISSIQGSGEEIRFERLLPKQLITITYVYSPPLDFRQINTYVQSDESEAKLVPVLLNRQWPKWLSFIALLPLFVGSIVILYFAYIAVNYIYVNYGSSPNSRATQSTAQYSNP